MTVQQMIELVFMESGEPTDLVPYDVLGDPVTFNLTTPGAQRILQYLNVGLVRIANWVFRDGRNLRFRGLVGRVYFRSGGNLFLQCEGIDALGRVRVMAGDLSFGVDGQLAGWTLEITGGNGAGQSRLVLDSIAEDDVHNLVLESPLDDVPDDDALRIGPDSQVIAYKNFYWFSGEGGPMPSWNIPVDPVTGIQDVMRVRDVTGKTDLSPTGRLEIFTQGIGTVGTPTEYRVMGNRLEFNTAPSEDRAYEIIYLKHPTELVTESQVPDIPLQYHEAITLWAVHNIQRLNSDYDGAYATKRELIDLMESLRLQGSFDYELEDSSITVY